MQCAAELFAAYSHPFLSTGANTDETPNGQNI
jgi:hypothetical protein